MFCSHKQYFLHMKGFLTPQKNMLDLKKKSCLILWMLLHPKSYQVKEHNLSKFK